MKNHEKNQKLRDLTESLQWRYAVKKFDASRKVEIATINELLNATRLSASSFGLQPWHFFVIQDPKTREEIKKHAWNQPQVTDCSALIVMASKKEMTADYIEGFVQTLASERGIPVEVLADYKAMMLNSLPLMQGEQGKAWMAHQVYISLGTLLAACAVAEIDSCPMEGFDKQAVDLILDLPTKGFNSRLLCPIGYRDPSDALASAKKVRMALGDVVEYL